MKTMIALVVFCIGVVNYLSYVKDNVPTAGDGCGCGWLNINSRKQTNCCHWTQSKLQTHQNWLGIGLEHG